MCNCLAHVSQEISSFNKNEDKELYTLIHCSPDDWKNQHDKQKKEKNNSVTDVSAWNCQCFLDQSTENSNEKFNIIPQKNYTLNEKNKVKDELDVECTLAIIKPSSFHQKESIEKKIINEGFTICAKKIVKLTSEQIFQFYHLEYGKIYFPLLVAYMSSGPIVVFVLAKHDAVREWRFLIGPTKVTEAQIFFPESIRALFGNFNGQDHENVVHGSFDLDQAQREIQFFFPGFIVEPILCGDKLEKYLWKNVNRIVTKGLIILCQIRPSDPISWLANWLMENNSGKPKMLIFDN